MEQSSYMLIESAAAYLTSLDWFYILILFLIMFVTGLLVPDEAYRIGKGSYRFSTKYRIVVLGFMLSYFISIFSDASYELFERQFKSMLFVLVLHLFILDAARKAFMQRLAPEIKEALKVIETDR